MRRACGGDAACSMARSGRRTARTRRRRPRTSGARYDRALITARVPDMCVVWNRFAAPVSVPDVCARRMPLSRPGAGGGAADHAGGIERRGRRGSGIVAYRCASRRGGTSVRYVCALTQRVISCMAPCFVRRATTWCMMHVSSTYSAPSGSDRVFRAPRKRRSTRRSAKTRLVRPRHLPSRPWPAACECVSGAARPAQHGINLLFECDPAVVHPQPAAAQLFSE